MSNWGCGWGAPRRHGTPRSGMTEGSVEGRIMFEVEGRPVRRHRTARSGMMESGDTRKGFGLGDSWEIVRARTKA